MATEIEGHPDNASAVLLGGFVVSAHLGERVEAVRFDAPDGLRAVLFIPDRRLSTADMRRVLPAEVPLRDAVSNLSRVAIGVAGIASGRFELLADLTVDRIHEPYRSVAYPQLPRLTGAARAAGALGAFLSGAGSTVLAFVAPGADASPVEAALPEAAAAVGLDGRTAIVAPRNAGRRSSRAPEGRARVGVGGSGSSARVTRSGRRPGSAEHGHLRLLRERSGGLSADRASARQASASRRLAIPVGGHEPVRLGLAADRPDRDDPAPGRPGLVALVVVVDVRADLGGRLGEVHPEDRRRLPLLAPSSGRSSRPAARVEVLDEGLERRVRLGLVGHEVGRAQDHHGPVVHGVVEARAGEDQAVEVGDRHADRLAVRGPEHPAGRGAVPVQPVALAPDGRRRGVRLAVERPTPTCPTIASSRMASMVARS